MNSQPGVSDCRERRETLSQRVQGIFSAAGESKSSGLAGALRAVYHSQGLAGFVISLMQILDLVSDRVERDPGGAGDGCDARRNSRRALE